MPAPKQRNSAPQKPARPTQTSAKLQLSPDEIRRLTAEAAYFRAEGRGFAPGYELDDWVHAEAEVRRRLTDPDKKAAA